MAKNNNLTDFVRDLADGFREKLGWPTTDKINPQDFRDFIDHSPSVGTLTIGLEPLNWTKTISNNGYEQVSCPTDTFGLDLYFDETTGTQRLPLIQFALQALDPIVGDGEIQIFDDANVSIIGRFTETETSDIKYILPVFGRLDTTQKEPFFPSFSISATGIPEAGVRIKMTANWVQIGSTQYPMFLSGATMRGYK